MERRRSEEEMERTGGGALPMDFIRLVCRALNLRDLCSAACTCHSWRTVSLEQWAGLAEQRWKLGWSEPGGVQMLKQAGNHLHVYRERHQVGVNMPDVNWHDNTLMI